MNFNAKKIVKIASLMIFLLIIVVFAFFRSRDLVFGVKITNVNIVDGTQYTQSVLNITGNAKNAVDLTINGRKISINHQGDFNEMIALLPGYNIINIEAKDKFGSIDDKNYKLMFTPI